MASPKATFRLADLLRLSSTCRNMAGFHSALRGAAITLDPKTLRSRRGPVDL
jgi:hypothetical protein